MASCRGRRESGTAECGGGAHAERDGRSGNVSALLLAAAFEGSMPSCEARGSVWVCLQGEYNADVRPAVKGLGAVVDQSTRFASVRTEVPGPGQYNLPAAAAAAPGVVAWRPAEEGASRTLLSAAEERMLSEMAGPVTSLPCCWRPRLRVRCHLAKLDVPFGFACRASTMPM